MKKSILALAVGTFGLGMSEFSMMGILPEIAESLNISIPKAGHFISAYAIGVAVGAPVLVLLSRNIPLKRTLLILSLIYLIGNLCFAISTNYGLCLAFRFISGLPHGAYFGVASIVAQKLAKPGKEASAIAGMISGMTIANLVGVPMGTFICHQFTWHATYLIIASIFVLIFWGIYTWIPRFDPLPNTGLKGQFKFLKHRAPWLIIVATIMGNGGIFAWFSYISPIMTKCSGFSPDAMTGVMMFAGLGMVVGNLAGGTLSDKFKPDKIGTVTQGVAAILLVGIFLFADIKWVSFLLMFCTTFCLFAVSAPQQLLILKNAKGGDLFAGACIQIAFNIGNALGATLGGIPISLKYSDNYAALPGVVLAVIGCMTFMYYCHYTKKQI